MEYLIGVSLALAVSIFATAIGFDRDRAFYPFLLMVVASYYDLFAIMGGSSAALARKSIIMAGFLLAAVVGFKYSMWLVAGGLLGHGIFDFFHGHLIVNPGLPVWWPMFCLSYDVAAAGYLAAVLVRRNRTAKTH